jgi:hypothetical protein
MRKAHFTAEQMVANIREAHRDRRRALATRDGLAQTIYSRHSRFGGSQATDVRRLKQLDVRECSTKKWLRALLQSQTDPALTRNNHWHSRTR